MIVNQIFVNLPFAGHREDSDSAFGVLLRLGLSNDGGGVLLAVPAGGSEISVSVPFGVVHADHGCFKRHSW